jgi:hypothetical protein
MKIKVYRPKNQIGIYEHKNDSFRELLEIWEHKGYIELINYDCKHIWMNTIGDILLYDRPTLEWLDEDLEYNLGLFGNPELPNNGKNNQHWIFWARHPKILNNNFDTTKESQTVFIGNIQNNIQLKYRDSTWVDVIQRYELILGQDYKYTNLEYLNIIGKFKYGLCLRGYGPKCHREIELMRLGTIPIFTPGCNMDYYNKLEENIHYLMVNNPEELKNKISSISEEKYNEMSKNCKHWYQSNCSPDGSFLVTMEIINSNTNDKSSNLSSISTMVTKNSEQDFINLMSSIKKYFPNLKVYVLCDSYIYNLFNFDNQCIFVNQLDKYTNLNRELMEQNNLWLEFMLKKTDIIDYALNHSVDTLFVDSDVYFLSEQISIDFNKQVGLSPHYIDKKKEVIYGKYNAGFIYVSDKKVTKYWREADHSDYFEEQGILDTFPDNFSYFEFNEYHNFGFWRINDVSNPMQVMNNLSQNNYCNQKIQCLHIHQLDMKYKNFIDCFELPRFTLILQYYNDTDQKRQEELDFCLIENLKNPIFKRVINLVESNVNVPENIKQHPNYHEVFIGKRLTYQEVFNYCNNNLKYESVVLSNLDIRFNNQTDLIIPKNQIVALSRVENNNYDLFSSVTSQDAWVFHPPVNIQNCNFELGSLGCDNAIADRISKSGYQIINRGTKFISFHIDKVRSNEKKKEKYIKNYPEKDGYLLLPDYDNINKLKINNLIDYRIKLDLINNYFKITH